MITFLKLHSCVLDLVVYFSIVINYEIYHKNATYPASFTSSFMSSQFYTILLSLQKVAEFEEQVLLS